MTRFWQVASAVAWRSIHKIATTPQLLIPSVVFPLFFFVAFAGGLSNVGNVPGFDAEFPSGYTAFQFVFVLIQASAFGGVFTGFGIASDFENGFARRLLLAAPNRYGIIAGYAIAAAARTTFVGALIFVIGLLTGMQVGGNGVDIAALVLLSYLVSLSATLFAAGVAMRLRTMQAGPLMQMPVFLVLFLAPVYVPLPLLSGWVHAVATVNPITPIVETGRDFISGTPGPDRARLRHRGRHGRAVRLVGGARPAQRRDGRRRLDALDDEDVRLRRAPAQLAQGRVVVGLVPPARRLEVRELDDHDPQRRVVALEDLVPAAAGGEAAAVPGDGGGVPFAVLDELVLVPGVVDAGDDVGGHGAAAYG